MPHLLRTDASVASINFLNTFSLGSNFRKPVLKNTLKNNDMNARCLKITEKVSFNIASEVYSLIKNAKNGPVWRVFENLKLAVKQCYQTGQFFIGQKLVENAKIEKLKCDILGDFQTLCISAPLIISS